MRTPSPPTSDRAEPPWPIARPARLPLASGEVHVWCARLDLAPRRGQDLERLLSEEERERFDRIRSPLARRRLAVARGVLREILAGYLGGEPRRLGLSTTSRGKPLLSLPGAVECGEPMAPGLHFNLSHSGGLALVAVGHGPTVGIDLETLRPVPAAGALARRFFTAGERAGLAAAPPGERLRAFLAVWTRKEACVKTLGDGFWATARRFEVESSPGSPARLLAVDGDGSAASGWTLRDLSPAPGYIAALAVRGGMTALRLLRLAEGAQG